MRSTIYRLSIAITVLLSCKQNTKDGTLTYSKSNARPQDSIKLKHFHEDSSLHLTLHEFLDRIMTKDTPKEFNFLGVPDEFPIDWVRESDIDTLMSLIDSKEKCRCILNPLSSYIPFDEEADLGGYAIRILNSFRNNKRLKFGLWECPKTNKKDVQELIIWRESQQK